MEFDAALRTGLIQEIGRERFDLWFGEGVSFRRNANQLVIATDSSFRVDRLRKAFLKPIKAIMDSLGYPEMSLEFTVQAHDTPSTPLLAARTEPSSSSPASKASPSESLARVGRSRRLQAGSAQRRGRRFRSLDTFVEGPSNQLACTSAQMVIREPGEVSPLLIHGPTGVGKTHLVEGIWSHAKRQNPRSRVLYLSAEQFTTYFLEALKGSGLPNFRQKYRRADLLIVDDIQFFAGKQATLVELAYTIDELSREGKQLILTADRPPMQLASLGRELLTRLNGGLVCGMKPIDAVTTETISKQWSAERGIVLDDEVHTQIASRIRGDARQLSGVLNRLYATSLAVKEPISLRMANDVIRELIPTQSRIIALKDVRKQICEMFGLEPNCLQQDSRSRKVTRPRMLAMWLARKHTGAGLHEISEFFGRRSHSSAVTAQKTVDGWLASGMDLPLNGQDCDVRDIVSQIETQLKAS